MILSPKSLWKKRGSVTRVGVALGEGRVMCVCGGGGVRRGVKIHMFIAKEGYARCLRESCGGAPLGVGGRVSIE